MGKLISYDIIFTNNPPVFVSGQSVSGTVVVHLRDAMKMRGVRARIYGRAYSRVEVRRTRSVSDGNGGSRTETYTETYTEYETYLDHQVTLWGKEVGHRSGDNPVLPAGRYDFNFNFMLPTNVRMPSSFENGYHCNIRYMITSNIDKPWKFDHVTKRAFTLLESIDVNEPSLVQRPFPLQNEKFLCCCCCRSGPLKLTASIDRCGYCPGEGILLNAECENLTNRTMNCVRARLNRLIIWRARGHSERRTRTDFEIKSPGQIEEGGSFNWSNQLICLPSIPPSITSCGIISVTYEFQISVVVPHGINLHCSFPIVIGTIPLRINYGYTPQPTAIQMPPPGTVMPSAEPLPGVMCMQPPLQPGGAPPPLGPGDIPPPLGQGSAPPPAIGAAGASMPMAPPPSYLACADGATDIKDSDDSDYLMGERNFAPMYSFVSNYQPPPPGALPASNPSTEKPAMP